MGNISPNPEQQQDEERTDKSNQIQHETSASETEDLIIFLSFETHQLQFSRWKCHRALTSPCLICFPCLFFSPLHFLWEPRLLSGVSPAGERVTSERPANVTVRKDTKTQR